MGAATLKAGLSSVACPSELQLFACSFTQLWLQDQVLHEGSVQCLKLFLQPQCIYTSVPQPEQCAVQAQGENTTNPREFALFRSYQVNRYWCGTAGVCAYTWVRLFNTALLATAQLEAKLTQYEWLLDTVILLCLWWQETPNVSGKAQEIDIP